MSSLAGHLWSTTLLLVALLVVCGVLLALRRGPALGPSRMRLIDRLPLEPRRAVYLVEIGDKVLVIGAGEGGLSRLGELDTKDLPLAKPDAPHASLVERWLAARSSWNRSPIKPGDEQP